MPHKPTGKPRGRPPKKDIDKIKKRVGRPPTEHVEALKEFKARIINNPKSVKVLESIIDAALDDNHKNQAAAWRLLMDRIAPIGMFEQDVIKNGSRPSIEINISGLGESTKGVTIEEETIVDV